MSKSSTFPNAFSKDLDVYERREGGWKLSNERERKRERGREVGKSRAGVR
jgi:hypothetical protein